MPLNPLLDRDTEDLSWSPLSSSSHHSGESSDDLSVAPEICSLCEKDHARDFYGPVINESSLNLKTVARPPHRSLSDSGSDIRSLLDSGLLGLSSDLYGNLSLAKLFSSELFLNDSLHRYAPPEAKLNRIIIDLITLLNESRDVQAQVYSVLANFSQNPYMLGLLSAQSELLGYVAKHFNYAYKLYHLPSSTREFRLHFSDLLVNTTALFFNLTKNFDLDTTELILIMQDITLEKLKMLALSDIAKKNRNFRHQILALFNCYVFPEPSPNDSSSILSSFSPRSMASPGLAMAFANSSDGTLDRKDDREALITSRPSFFSPPSMTPPGLAMAFTNSSGDALKLDDDLAVLIASLTKP